MSNKPISHLMKLVNVLALSFLSALYGCASRPTSTPHSGAALAQFAEVSGDDIPALAQRTAWRFAGADGQIITTAHYDLYTTLSEPEVVDRLLVFAEHGLKHYTSALADLPMPSGHLETYLFQTRQQWEAKTRQLLPTQAATFLNLGRGGFTTRGRSVLYYIDYRGRTRDTFAILAHEGWHQYAQSSFRRQLPVWLEEGLATYMEGYLTDSDGNVEFLPWANRERYRTLRQAVRARKIIPLDEVITRTPQSFLEVSKDELLVYYSQVWALIHFLNEGQGGKYRSSLIQILKDVSQGRMTISRTTMKIDPADVRPADDRRKRMASLLLRQLFDVELEAFHREYVQFVQDIVTMGGYDRIDQGVSPLAE